MNTMKTWMQHWALLILTLLGVILIGLGCGISVFEISEYKLANYNTNDTNTNLPVLETTTLTLEAPLTGNSQFKLDTYSWFDKHTIRVDNSLQDMVQINITTPKDLYQFWLEEESTNHYSLSTSSHDLGTLRLALQLAKEGYILDYPPTPQIELVMSEAQAKNFQLNEERDAVADIRTSYEEKISSVRADYESTIQETQTDYEERISDMENNYDNTITQMQEEYEQMLQEQQSNYEEQVASYEEQVAERDEQIEMLQQQLEQVRNSLN